MQNQIRQNLDKRMIFKEFLAATMRKMMLSVYEYCTHAFREGRSKKAIPNPAN